VPNGTPVWAWTDSGGAGVGGLARGVGGGDAGIPGDDDCGAGASGGGNVVPGWVTAADGAMIPAATPAAPSTWRGGGLPIVVAMSSSTMMLSIEPCGSGEIGPDRRGALPSPGLGSSSPSASRSTAVISRVLTSNGPSSSTTVDCASGAMMSPTSGPSPVRVSGRPSTLAISSVVPRTAPDASEPKLYAIDTARFGSSGTGGTTGGWVGVRRGTLSDGTRSPAPRRRRRRRSAVVIPASMSVGVSFSSGRLLTPHRRSARRTAPDRRPRPRTSRRRAAAPR
jgi:hypothetical protein